MAAMKDAQNRIESFASITSLMLFSLFAVVGSASMGADTIEPMFPNPKGCSSIVRFTQCSPEDIDRVEKELNVRFPNDYRKYLLERNSISLKDAYFRSNGRSLEVWAIYGVNPEHVPVMYDVRHGQIAYEFKERVPAGIIKIGHSVSGYNAICISTRKADFGRVFFWDPQVPWEDGPNVQTMQYLKPLANSFQEFWDSLAFGDS